MVTDCLRDDFKLFLDKTRYEEIICWDGSISSNHKLYGKFSHSIGLNKETHYNLTFRHNNITTDNDYNSFKRRIERFRDIIKHPKKIYFVYINEDYFYDEEYRLNDFNDNIFNEMLELEKFIRNKYIGIDYNILYFNFKHHNIPSDSNIINVILHSTEVYNTRRASPYEDFRNFCGKILSEIFNTHLNTGYDESVFNN